MMATSGSSDGRRVDVDEVDRLERPAHDVPADRRAPPSAPPAASTCTRTSSPVWCASCQAWARPATSRATRRDRHGEGATQEHVGCELTSRVLAAANLSAQESRRACRIARPRPRSCSAGRLTFETVSAAPLPARAVDEKRIGVRPWWGIWRGVLERLASPPRWLRQHEVHLLRGLRHAARREEAARSDARPP